jgi:hypothetical protein
MAKVCWSNPLSVLSSYKLLFHIIDYKLHASTILLLYTELEIPLKRRQGGPQSSDYFIHKMPQSGTFLSLSSTAVMIHIAPAVRKISCYCPCNGIIVSECLLLWYFLSDSFGTLCTNTYHMCICMLHAETVVKFLYEQSGTLHIRTLCRWSDINDPCLEIPETWA